MVSPDSPQIGRRWRVPSRLLSAGLVAVAMAAGIAPMTAEPSERRPVSDPASRPTPAPTAESLVRTFLDARARALLAGNEHGWLVGLDADRELLAGQRQIFGNLRRMKTVHYAYRVLRVVEETSGLRATVAVEYCFANPGCDPPESEAVVRFRSVRDGVVMTGYTPFSEVRPWEVGRLAVSVGRRVILAAQPRYRGALGRLRVRADRAAARAARFGPRDITLSRPVIFIGRPGKDSTEWYGQGLEDVDDGMSYLPSGAVDEPIRTVDHLFRGDRMRKLSPYLFQWHLGLGAASLDINVEDLWARQFATGIAYHLAYGVVVGGSDPAGWQLGSDLKRVLAAWNGKLESFHPDGGDDSDAWDTAAWAAVYRLIHKYGRSDFIDFYNAVARDGVAVEAATREHLGKSVSRVQRDLVRYLRSLG